MSPKMKDSGASAAAIAFVTQGTYQRDIISLTGQAWTAGTEFEIADVSDVIIADTADKDELFSWVRGQMYIFISGSAAAFEWMLLRQDTADGLPDLNTNSVVEELQKDKRILARGFYLTATHSYQPPPKVKFEVYKVPLRYGEELRLVVRPLSTTADQGTVYGLLEWRQVGV